MNKRKFPLIILTQLNHIKENFPSESKRVKAVDSLLRFEDKIEESDFYFQINSYGLNTNNDFVYSVTYYPLSQNVLKSKSHQLTFDALEKTLQKWGSVLKLFNDTEYFEDDETIKYYTNEFFNEYKLIEEDADINPFDIKRQILIDNYLLILSNILRIMKKLITLI